MPPAPAPARAKRSVPQWVDEPAVMESAELFVDHLTVLYGPSESGKTIFIRSLLQRLSGLVPEGSFFSGTEKSFAEIPATFVHQKVTEDLLRSIWDRQSVKADIFRRANRRDVLARLASRVPDSRVDTCVRRVDSLQAREMAKLGKGSKAFSALKSKCEELVLRIYRVHVDSHRTAISALKLPADEAHAFKFLHFNPRHVVVFDDVSPQIYRLRKKEIVAEYFTRGRHNFITVILSLHDDKFIESELRKNAHTSIFTTPEMIQVFTKRDCMGLSKALKGMANQIASDERAFESFGKIAYLKSRSARDHPFVRVRAEVIDEGQLRFGSRSWNAFGNSIASNGAVDPSNPFNVEFGASCP